MAADHLGPVDPAASSRCPAKATLAERLFEEADVQRLLALEAVLLCLLYAGGLRVPEVCWRDTLAHGDGRQVTVYGKGAKTRVILLSATTWRTLSGLRGDAGPNNPPIAGRAMRWPLLSSDHLASPSDYSQTGMGA